jgi:hypothetical protein
MTITFRTLSLAAAVGMTCACSKSPSPLPLPSRLETVTIKSSSLGADSLTIRFRHDASGKAVGKDIFLSANNIPVYDFYEISYPVNTVISRYGWDKGTAPNRSSQRYADTTSLGSDGPLVWRIGQTDMVLSGLDTVSESINAVTRYIYGPEGLLQGFNREGQKQRVFAGRTGVQLARLSDTAVGTLTVQNGNLMSLSNQVRVATWDSALGLVRRTRSRYAEIREFSYTTNQPMPAVLVNELAYRNHYLLDPLLFATGTRFRNLPDWETYTINYFREDGSLQDQTREQRQYIYRFTQQGLLLSVRMTTTTRWEEHRYQYSQD